MWRKCKREPKHLFLLGQVVATPAALELMAVNSVNPSDLLDRHVTGDWGDVSDGDRQMNDEAVKDGDRLHSVYPVGAEKIWVITERDRSVTTLLTPDDY